ncbi:hypothetical protein GGP57_003307 [Salinibacter ruber]|nr:hypothetical protein [Salinibacter ruber]MCS3715481.1 hypothetical protein [Salinibacter ruber]
MYILLYMSYFYVQFKYTYFILFLVLFYLFELNIL